MRKFPNQMHRGRTYSNSEDLLICTWTRGSEVEPDRHLRTAGKVQSKYTNPCPIAISGTTISSQVRISPTRMVLISPLFTD